MEQLFKNVNINGEICDILCRDIKIEKIGKIDGEGIDFKGKRAYAGLVDIHTHGMGGIDTMDAELDRLSELYAKSGTTTVYPTTMTAPHDDIVKVLTYPIHQNGAKIFGIHLEGPYISENRKGAQNSEYIRLPDINEFKDYPMAKIITVAPELEGAAEYIENTDMLVCVGHTDADYETVIKAADVGAKCVTHTFNAMPPLHHREPSVVGAAFDKDMYVQVICDGKHIHPSVIRMLYRLFGSDRMILISDSMRATGLPDGKYEFGGQEMTVTDGTARTPDGALAGSTSTLFDCVKCAIDFGIPEKEAFKMASETPAKMMGLNCGKIAEGFDCDLIVVDDNNRIDTVIINGEIFGGEKDEFDFM